VEYKPSKRQQLEVKNNVEMANSIADLINSLGMRNSKGGQLGADLSDIYFSLRKYRTLLNKLLRTDPNNLEAIQDILVGIKVQVLEHIDWHIKQLKTPMEQVINHCDRKLD
jgi:hypothetical protein